MSSYVLYCFLLQVCLWMVLTYGAPPKPPKIPQAFSTNYMISLAPYAYGAPLIAGFFALNDPKSQAFITEQDPGTTPYILQTSTIAHPVNESFVQAYQFLNEGRCWTLPGNVNTTNFHYFPLTIPSYASFSGNVTIHGHLAGVWDWYYTYEIITVALSMTVRWFDGGVMAFELTNTDFFIFKFSWTSTNWNSTAPPDQYFDIPPGPCPPPPYTSELDFEPLENEKKNK